VPNSGMDTRFQYLERFEYLAPDRLQFVWEALGHGWIVSLTGAAMLAAAPRACSTPTALPIAPLVAVAAALVLLAAFGLRPAWAEYMHRLGDRELALGRHAAAADAYARAASADPVIARSTPFMIKLSGAYYAVAGAQEPYALLYLANGDIERRAYDSAFAKLKFLSATSPASSALRAGYLQAARKVERSAYLIRGLAAYTSGNKNAASRDFKHALAASIADSESVDAHFLAARIDMDLGLHSACAARAERLLGSGAVSRKSVRADLYNTAADCYARMHEYARAREAYLRSYDLDNRTNYRAYQGLSGT